MSTGNPNPSPAIVLDASKKQWLAQTLGGKDFYAVSPDLKATDAKGQPVDFQALEKTISDLESKGDASEEELKQLAASKAALASFGIPSMDEEIAAFNSKKEKKEKTLTSLRNLLDLQKEEIRSSTDFEVLVQKRMAIGGKEILYGSKTVRSKEDEAEREFDSVYYKNRLIQGPTAEQKKALDLVITQLTLLTEKLKANEEYDFSPQELMDELWTPLVREKLISEDQCPAEFSRVLQLFRGASNLYNKRLETYARANEDPDKFEGTRDVLGDISSVLGIGASATDLVLSLVGTSTDIRELTALAAKCTQSLLKTGTSLMEKEREYKEAGENVSEILESVLTTVLGGGEQAKTIGKLASGAFSSCVNLGLFAKKLVERQYDDGFDMLADGIGEAITCVAEATGNDILEKVANSTATALKGVFKSGKLVYLLNEVPVDTTEVRKTITGMVEATVKLTVRNAVQNTIQKDDLEKEKSEAEKGIADSVEGDDRDEAIEKAVASFKEEQDDDLDDYDEYAEKIFAGADMALDKISDMLKSKVEEKAAEKRNAALEKEIEESRELFSKKLGVAFNVSMGTDSEDEEILTELYSVDSLIAQIQSDRARIALFNKIFDAVGGSLTTLIPQLGGPLKAKAFALNLSAAMDRSNDVTTFTDLLSDARKASSPQAATLLSEIDELKRHYNNASINAAIAFCQMVSLSAAAIGDLATGAMGAGAVVGVAGRAVSAGMEVLKQTQAFLNKKFEDAKVKQAWEMYERAVRNPEDRRHIMKTFRANPTLAKYGIAYGAIQMGDSVAKETLRQAGINDAILAQEDTSAEKVVMFLEIKFENDIKVEGTISRFAPDTSNPLTLAVWLKNKEAAASPENPESMRWKKVATVAIDTAISEAEKAAKEIQKKDIRRIQLPSQWSGFKVAWDNYIDKLRGLQTALRSFKPLTETGNAFDRFQNYLNELISIAEGKIEEAQKDILIQESLLKSRKQQLEAAISVGKDCETACEAVVTTLGTAVPTTPQKFKDEVLLAQADTLVTKLAQLTILTPQFSASVDFLNHGVERANRTIARALKTNDSAVLEETFNTLVDDISACKTTLVDQCKAIALDLSKYP